jgi:gamma-glutamyl-gamma-aminobutyraldehyde dehydrogenase
VKKLTDRVAALVVGDGLDERTQVGPMIDEGGLKKVIEHVEDARRRGAKVLCGGRVRDGRWYEPTVLTGVSPECRILREETFGPVAPVVPFRSEDEVVRLANDTPYGLAASIYTDDLNVAHRVARDLRAGVVGVNAYSEGDMTTPFGGYKLSGFGGHDKSVHAHDQYTETKTTWIALRSRP